MEQKTSMIWIILKLPSRASPVGGVGGAGIGSRKGRGPTPVGRTGAVQLYPPGVSIRILLYRLEKAEMDAAVDLFLDESRVVLERMLIAVLQNQISLGIDQAGIQNLVRNRFQTFERVRRIGEHDVELLLADRNEIEDVVVHRSQVLQPQLPGLVLHER